MGYWLKLAACSLFLIAFLTLELNQDRLYGATRLLYAALAAGSPVVFIYLWILVKKLL